MSTPAFAQSPSDGEALEASEARTDAVALPSVVENCLASPEVVRQVWESFSDIIFLLDLEGRFLYINRAGEKLTGRKRDDWVGRHFLSLIHPEDTAAAVAAFEAGLRGRQLPVEVRVRHVSNDYVRLSVNSTPIYDPPGRLLALFSIAHDISQLRQAERELARQNEILVALNSITQELASPAEQRNQLRRALATLVEVLQLDGGALLRLPEPLPRNQLEWPPDGPYSLCQCSPLEEPGRSRLCERVDAGGEILQVPDREKPISTLWRAFPKEEFAFHICLPLACRSHLQGFVHLAARQPRKLSEIEEETLRSVGTQIGVVLENWRLYHSLLTQVDRFKALMKGAQNILSKKSLTSTLEAIVDEAVRILRADRCAIFLRSAGPAQLECALARGLSPAYIRFVIERICDLPGRALLARSGPIVIPEMAEVDMAREIAAREGVRSAAVFPLETGGELLGGIAFYHNSRRTYTQEDLEIGQLLSHQVAIAVQNARHFEEAEKRAHEVETKNQELEEFVSIASHDLRAPLISIEGFASRLLQMYGDRLDDEGRRFLQRIVENTRYMYALTQSLLNLSLASRHSGPPAECDLNEIVGEVVRNLQSALNDSGAEMVIRPLPGIIGDPVGIRQMFANLIDNAVKFVHPRRMPKIEVGYDPPDLFVRDNGVGIPADKQDAIFRSMYRLHEVSCDGLGMGLSIVRKIMERHGGRVWVESDGRTGSTFRMRFPKDSIVSGNATAAPLTGESDLARAM